MRIANCKELNFFEHYNILENIEVKQCKSIIDKYNLNNNSTVELKDNKGNISIIHKSTKIENVIQISHFDSNLNAISDKEYFSIEDVIINEVVNHKVFIVNVR